MAWLSTRCRRVVSLSEVEHIARMGVKFMLEYRDRCGATAIRSAGDVNAVGFDVLNEWHDAIFLATGLGETNRLNIPGEDLDGVYRRP